MKKLLLFLLILWAAIPLSAQISQSTTPIGFGANLPATCNPISKSKVLFFKTTATAGLYSCTATNTWTIIGGGGGGGGINPALGITPSIAGYYPAATTPIASTLNSISGNNDLYTVPSGRKALVYDFTTTNSTAGSINIFPAIKISGTYYRIGNSVSEGTGGTGQGHIYGMSSAKNSAPIVLNAGESFSVNTDAVGLSIWAHLVEFDATAPLSRASITSFTAGDNTLLTVTTGKTLIMGSQGFASNNNPVVSMQGITYYNNSGAQRTMGGIYLVPSGGSPNNANRFATSNTVFSGLGFNKYLAGNIASGSSIVINTDSNAAGQFVWVNYQEF